MRKAIPAKFNLIELHFIKLFSNSLFLLTYSHPPDFILLLLLNPTPQPPSNLKSRPFSGPCSFYRAPPLMLHVLLNLLANLVFQSFLLKGTVRVLSTDLQILTRAIFQNDLLKHFHQPF